jgi:hypothetical protein
VALTILHDLVSLHSSVDDYGELVTPAPVVKRILSSPRCLPHLAQVSACGSTPGMVGLLDIGPTEETSSLKNVGSLFDKNLLDPPIKHRF